MTLGSPWGSHMVEWWMIPRYGLLIDRNMINVIKVLRKVVKILQKRSKKIAISSRNIT
jgi:hypothetical protein